MKFMSKWRNTTYVIKPTLRRVDPTFGVTVTPGLRAKFKGFNGIFDSELAQQQFQWSDEDRIFVERKLLGHNDFGVGLFLAPGEKLTDEEWSYARRKPTVQKRRCLQIAVLRGEIVQCNDEALPGKDYCHDHDPDRSKIIKGGVTQK